MLTKWCRYSVVLVLFMSGTACHRSRPETTAPADPFVNVGAAQLPVTALAGSPALLFPVGGILFGDSLGALILRRGDLLDRATAVLDSVLARDARGVAWQNQEAMRRVLARTPGLAGDPSTLPTGFLLAKRVEAIPDPLWSSIRVLGGLTGARMALVPVAVRLEGREGAVRGTYVFAILDARLGHLTWRGRVTGPPAATPEAALLLAAVSAVPSGM